MKIPTLELANEFLEEGQKLNPGPWIAHSKNAARAAEAIARYDNSLCPETAYILGLLHDIGRRFGFSYYKHTIDGYNFLKKLGFDDAARICMTHTFDSSGNWDCSKEEYDFVIDFFSNVEFNEYDLLIQLCDVLSLSTGFCLLEQRLVDAAIRNGTIIFKEIRDMTEKWKTIFNIKMHFENKIGCSIYTLLPGVIENTFRISTDDISKYLSISSND